MHHGKRHASGPASKRPTVTKGVVQSTQGKEIVLVPAAQALPQTCEWGKPSGPVQDDAAPFKPWRRPR